MSNSPALPEKIESSAFEVIKSALVPSAKEIDISYFSHRHRRSTQLIGNQFEANFIKARKEWMDFDFTELIYVTSLIVFADGYEEYHELELSYEDLLSGNTKKTSSRYDGEAFNFSIDAFVGGFGLQPSERWFKDSRLTRIEIQGVEQRSFSEVIAVMRNLNAEVSRIETALNQYLEKAKAAEARRIASEQQAIELDRQLEERIEKLEELKEEIATESAELDKLKKEIGVNESVRRNVDSQTAETRSQLEKLKSSSAELAREVQEREARLRNLQNDINLFPTEISGYVTQGAKNVSLYFWLCIIPILVIVFVTFRLFYNSERLLEYNLSGSVNIFDFIISRLPYAFLSIAVLAICYTVLNRLISEIIGINRRRQDLFKISIIATDVSYASQEGLGLSDEEAYNLRTQTKMELLKEHLRQHLGEEFVYKPRHHFLQRVASVFSRHVDEERDEETTKSPTAASNNKSD